MKKRINQQKLIDQLSKKFPNLRVKPGSEWDDNSSAILWSGEGSEINDLPAFNSDSYYSDPEEKIWIMGVHKSLVKWSEKKGLYWEPYDSGTWLAYLA